MICPVKSSTVVFMIKQRTLLCFHHEIDCAYHSLIRHGNLRRFWIDCIDATQGTLNGRLVVNDIYVVFGRPLPFSEPRLF